MKQRNAYAWVCNTLLCSFLIMGYSTVLFSQPARNGVVFDADHQPVPGATVMIKGSAIGTSTDNQGNFFIPAKPGDVLEVSAVGMVKQQVKLQRESIAVIILSYSVNNLDEVMVVGYGTSKRKDITGAISKLTPKVFNSGVVTNPLQQLQGKVAGLVITQPGGDPNGELVTRVRGATSLEGQAPLLVIDGIALDNFNKAATTLHPGDIESYDILKDASAAAIYGARGANGVIIITTKSGKPGTVSTNYTGFVSLEKPANQLSMLNADQWRETTLTTGGPGFDKNADTDWQRAITQNAFTQSHLVGLGGGNERIKFRGSVGYTRQEGIVLNSGKEILTARLSVDQKSLGEKLEISYNINTTVIKRNFLPDQESTDLARRGGAFVFSQAIGYLPVWPIHNADGSYYQPPANVFNPVFLLKELYSEQRENFFQGSINAEYAISRKLKIGVLGALSRGNDVYDRFWPAIAGAGISSLASKFNYNRRIFSGDMHGSFIHRFGKQSIEVTGVYEYNNFINDDFGITVRDLLVPGFLNNNLGAANNVLPGDVFSHKTENRLISFLGRAVYNFNDKYIATLNFRRDGSSKFGPNNRWGNFPSAAFAWTISNEPFLKKPGWFDHLKLRISYGLTGNQDNLRPHAYQLLYGPVGPYLWNGQFYQSYAVIQEHNPDLQWEVRKSFNAGLDFSILSERLSGTLDVFNDNTNKMLFLYDLPQPPFLYNQVTANAARGINKGFELTLSGMIVEKENFKWSVQVNFATLRNRLTNLSGTFRGQDLSIVNRHYGYADGPGYSGSYISELKIGYPAGVFWLPQHAGLDNNGKELFYTYDSSGKQTGKANMYTDLDRVYIDPTPDFSWGFTSNTRLRQFDLHVFFRGVQGQKIFANSLMIANSGINLPGVNVSEGALTNGFTEQPVPSTYWIRNGSFIRLENLSIGYTLNQHKLLKKCRIYLTATNLVVITPYDGIDPEIVTEGSQRYIDNRYYPRTKGFVIGLDIEL